MANKDTTPEVYSESEGLQWEISKKNVSGSDYGTADDFFHHNWQELSLKKSLRSYDECANLLETMSSQMNRKDLEQFSDIVSTAKYNLEQMDEASRTKVFTETYGVDFNDDGSFSNPLSPYAFLKSASEANEAATKKANDELEKSNKKNKYNYEDYLDKFTRTADNYKNETKFLGTYASKDAVDAKEKQYEQYGGITYNTVTENGVDVFKVYVPAETQAEMYNQTEAVRLAKLEAKWAKSQDNNSLKSSKNKEAEAKQKHATVLTVLKEASSKNDNIRKQKKKIEDAKAKAEQEKENLNKAKEEEKAAAEAANKSAADKYEAEMLKAGKPISQEEKDAYLNDLNAKSDAKINGKYTKKEKKVTDRCGTLTAKAEAATATESTSELFASMEGEASSKKASLLDKAKGLAASAMGIYSNAMNILNGGLDLSKFNIDLVSKMGLMNNKLFGKLFSQLGLKEGLFDNVISDLYKVGAAYAKDMLNSAIKLGMSKLMDKGGGAVDESLLKTVKPLVFAGGDPNYNGTFLKYILLADCPKCLQYLDEYNGITTYTLDSPGKEYARGMTAANNGCHKVALYVAKKLYEQYKLNCNGTATAKKEVGAKYAAEIKKIFKAVIVKSYNSFSVEDLKDWFYYFGDLLYPCMLGTGDIHDSGKYKIAGGDINTIAKLVEVSEFSLDNMKSSVTFSATTGMKIDGKDTGGKFGKNNISQSKKYIDVRNKNIKKIYAYLVSNPSTKSEKLTNKDLHDRLSYPALSALSKAQNNLVNNIANSDTFKDASYLANDVIRATVHRTLTLMASNHLIPFASNNSGNIDFKDTTGSIPEFTDYSTSTITFYNYDNTSETQTVSNGKATALTANTFTRIGYKFKGWSLTSGSTEVKYTNKEKITVNGDLRLYAVWEVSADTIPGSSESTEETNNVVNNSVTEEEINENIDSIISTVQTPSVMKQYELTFNNFKCVDLYNKTLTEIASETSDTSFEYIFEKIMNAYSDLDSAYSIEHNTELFTNKKSVYNEISNENDKLTIYYYALCYTIVREYAKTMPYSSLESMFGSTTSTVSYEIDEAGQFVLDIYGNKIVSNIQNVNSIDLKFKECLSIFRDVCSKIYEYYYSISNQNRYTVEFDLCGLSDEHIPSFRIGAYESIEDYEPVEPEAEGFVFKGWSTDPNGTKLVNWQTTTFFKNTILFAIWEKAECYVKDFTLRKDKNESLSADVVGTVDNAEGIIRLFIRESEVSENKRYYIHMDLSYGCTADINTKQKMFISETSPSDVNITDAFGNTKYYFIELFVIPNDESRISYITNGGIISDNATYRKARNTQLESLPTLTKEGYEFKGWSLDGRNISENIEVGNVSTVLYPVLEEIKYNITYFNFEEDPFDGRHEMPYYTDISYYEGKTIDTPVKTGYVFDGYYRDKNCVGTKINALYKYNYTSDSSLYANWIDETEYNALHGITTINGIDVRLSDLIFYTRMIMANNERWVISGTGLNVFASNGNKLRSLSGLIGGKNYIPEGIATIGSESNSTILVVVRHSSKNKVFIYSSSDKGMTWERVMECTRLNLLISDSTGAETIRYLTFYQTIAYNGHFYSVETVNGESAVIIDGDENNVLLSSSNSKFNITRNRKILGISATVAGKLYVLFENVGVICYTYFEPTFDSEGNFVSLNINMKAEGVGGWSDNFYNIDYVNIGNPYAAIQMNMNLDDDFDINDQDIINNLNSYYEDKYKYIKTYLKIEDDQDPISDKVWLWTFNFARTGIILSEKSWIVENMNDFRPTTLKNRSTIQLEVKPKHINYEIKDSIDPEEVRKVHMTQDNCIDYLGWTRVIYNTSGEIIETIKITRDYLDEMEISDGTVSETWDIKYTRSELVVKELTTATGEKFTAEVYNTPEMKQSDVFKKYLKFGKI